jgi:septal ring factor EnvC (AmiA/AmiB activator)
MAVRGAALVLLAALDWPQVPLAHAQVDTGQQAASGMIAQQLDEIAATILASRVQISRMDDMVLSLDDRLNALYAQRDAAEDDPARQRQLDDLIDRMNLTLTRAEAQRDQMKKLLDTLESSIGPEADRK